MKASKIVRLGVLVGFLLPLGCADDPYSAKRIRMRREAFQDLAADVEKRENDGYRRMEEADRTLDKWWRRDCARFNRIAPTVGDYFY